MNSYSKIDKRHCTSKVVRHKDNQFILKRYLKGNISQYNHPIKEDYSIQILQYSETIVIFVSVRTNHYTLSNNSMMTLEEYNQLDADFAHCPGPHCKKANECLRHTAHKMLAKNTRDCYMTTNPAVITGNRSCPLFMPDRRERYAWGISRIFDNVRAADLRGVRLSVMQCFGSATYYHVKEQLRAITEEEQQDIREAFTERGYDGQSIEFDRYEEHYPALMRMKHYK